MAYAFKHTTGVADQVRSIAKEQIDRAVDAIDGSTDFDATVHFLRRSCKKLRALLKLIRPVFADYDTEATAIEAIADRFSVARDAAVMVQTLSQIVESSGEGHADWGLDAVTLLDRLRERAWHLRRQTGEDELLHLAASDFRAAGERVENWSFEASRSDIVMPGIKRSYRQFRSRLVDAVRTPEGEVVHDWRKAAKAFWYHTRLFEQSAPAVLGDLTRQLDVLGELLGDHHNLTVLTDWIVSSRGPGDGVHDALLAVIAERQAAKLDQAIVLAQQLTVEQVGAVERRFRGYWKLLE
jgi:CHAD domain-containing protein